MDEEEFDSRLQWDAFTTKDAARTDARLRRCATLGFALWGATPDGLTRQLLAPVPQIPPGFDLADFRELQRFLQSLSLMLASPGYAKFIRPFLPSRTISAGTQHFNMLEAQCEIVRRAIEHLQSH
ncbi:MAG TPA: hypothetical protein VMM16_02585 [Verrucomicrobiae bacterium]|nr:hypothetical protein [Verrucomicrobiae bacterium]